MLFDAQHKRQHKNGIEHQVHFLLYNASVAPGSIRNKMSFYVQHIRNLLRILPSHHITVVKVNLITKWPQYALDEQELMNKVVLALRDSIG